MSNEVTIKVPDIGDFDGVEVIEILVQEGSHVDAEDPLITLESDKAAMDVPSTHTGVVKKLLVAMGDTVSEGSPIAVVESQESSAEAEAPEELSPDQSTVIAPSSAFAGEVSAKAQVLVLGSGPGGYTAAFRAADLGLDVVLVERDATLGGVCLNVGCIPSKALLHAAKVIDDAAAMADHGVVFAKPEIHTDKLRNWKDSVISRLTGGLATMAKQRKVRVERGYGRFLSPNHVQVTSDNGDTRVIEFEHGIVAAGSEPVVIPGFPKDPRVMDSTSALELEDLPERMLVIGGGIIGLEMACVYDALGVKVSVVELTKTLIPGCDKDLVRPLQKRIEKRYESIMLGTKVETVETVSDGVRVTFSGDNAPEPQVYGRVLVAVGRKPNGALIDADKAGLQVDERGFISVDKQMRTNVANLFAIGDIVGQPMLAHKATHEAKIAAEVIAGKKSAFDARVIPSVAYTDPEVAWVGVTEAEASKQGRKIGKASFPWAASGRALSLGRPEGATKLIFDPDNERVIGAGIVGPNAGDLIAEVALAIEMGADAADIGLTIHPHPTLSESVAMAAEMFEGTITDLYLGRK